MSPFLHNRQQQEWDKQANIAYELDLNWRDATVLQENKDEKKSIDQLNRLATSGLLPSYLGSEGALEAERVRLQEEIGTRTARLESFRVVEDYREIEVTANDLTERIHQLVNQNVRDRKFIDLYQQRMSSEQDAVVTSLDVTRL